MSIQRIAVIGGGFSGALTCANLVKAANAAGKPCEITLFEPKARVGLGVAYSTECQEHLLNVPAGKMGAWAQEPENFLNWLNAKGFQAEFGSFVPRRWYGQYVQEIFESAQREAAGKLTQAPEMVTSISNNGAGYSIRTSNNSTYNADVVVLAIGNFSQNEPFPVDAKLIESGQYITNPWAPGSLNNLNSSSQLILIGGGLTAVDMVVEARQRGFNGKIVAISRHGFLPTSHTPAKAGAPQPSAIKGSKTTTLRQITAELRDEIAHAQESGKNWRAVIDALRPETQSLWRNLTDLEKKRFLRHLKPYWEVHRHRIAPNIAGRIEKELESDSLEMMAGRVIKVEQIENGVKLLVKKRSNGECVEFHTQRIINCTGPSPLLDQSCPELIRSLLESGHCQTDSLSMGLASTETGQVIGSDGTPTKGLYVIGSLRKGELWETTAVPELRGQAKQIADQIAGNS